MRFMLTCFNWPSDDGKEDVYFWKTFFHLSYSFIRKSLEFYYKHHEFQFTALWQHAARSSRVDWLDLCVKCNLIELISITMLKGILPQVLFHSLPFFAIHYLDVTNSHVSKRVFSHSFIKWTLSPFDFL